MNIFKLIVVVTIVLSLVACHDNRHRQENFYHVNNPAHITKNDDCDTFVTNMTRIHGRPDDVVFTVGFDFHETNYFYDDRQLRFTTIYYHDVDRCLTFTDQYFP